MTHRTKASTMTATPSVAARPHSISVVRGPSVFPPSPLTPPHFLGLAPHPGNTAPPAPRRPKLPPLPTGWTRTFHAVPAAYPKQIRESHGTLSRESHPYGNTRPVSGESKKERNARVQNAVGQALLARLDGEEWTLEAAAKAKPEGLFLAVERWKRDVPVGGQTIVCTHPNGTQKEHWHPTLHRILARAAAGPSPGFAFGTGDDLGTDPNVLIDDIWLIDHWNHGSSVDLNEGLLGAAEVWDDVGRDILNFVLHVLPDAKAKDSNTLPWQLPWLPENASLTVPIIGFGGSYGGLGHVMAAHARPDVYLGVFLADTLIMPRALDRADMSAENEEEVGTSRVRGAMKRRDAWPSRAEASRTWLKNDFYAVWHPEVFALTLSHGLVRVGTYGKTDTQGDPDVDDAPVVLATPTWAEASVFIEPVSSARAWDMLPQLKVPVAFLVAQNRFPERLQKEEVWRAPLARNELLPDTGHLCLQENPPAVADAAWRFLQTLAAGKWGSKEEIRASYDALEGKAKL